MPDLGDTVARIKVRLGAQDGWTRDVLIQHDTGSPVHMAVNSSIASTIARYTETSEFRVASEQTRLKYLHAYRLASALAGKLPTSDSDVFLEHGDDRKITLGPQPMPTNSIGSSPATCYCNTTQYIPPITWMTEAMTTAIGYGKSVTFNSVEANVRRETIMPDSLAVMMLPTIVFEQNAVANATRDYELKSVSAETLLSVMNGYDADGAVIQDFSQGPGVDVLNSTNTVVVDLGFPKTELDDEVAKVGQTALLVAAVNALDASRDTLLKLWKLYLADPATPGLEVRAYTAIAKHFCDSYVTAVDKEKTTALRPTTFGQGATNRVGNGEHSDLPWSIYGLTPRVRVDRAVMYPRCWPAVVDTVGIDLSQGEVVVTTALTTLLRDGLPSRLEGKLYEGPPPHSGPLVMSDFEPDAWAQPADPDIETYDPIRRGHFEYQSNLTDVEDWIVSMQYTHNRIETTGPLFSEGSLDDTETVSANVSVVRKTLQAASTFIYADRQLDVLEMPVLHGARSSTSDRHESYIDHRKLVGSAVDIDYIPEIHPGTGGSLAISGGAQRADGSPLLIDPSIDDVGNKLFYEYKVTGTTGAVETKYKEFTPSTDRRILFAHALGAAPTLDSLIAASSSSTPSRPFSEDKYLLPILRMMELFTRVGLSPSKHVGKMWDAPGTVLTPLIAARKVVGPLDGKNLSNLLKTAF
jgi:hypothetical protein